MYRSTVKFNLLQILLKINLLHEWNRRNIWFSTALSVMDQTPHKTTLCDSQLVVIARFLYVCRSRKKIIYLRWRRGQPVDPAANKSTPNRLPHRRTCRSVFEVKVQCSFPENKITINYSNVFSGRNLKSNSDIQLLNWYSLSGLYS